MSRLKSTVLRAAIYLQQSRRIKLIWLGLLIVLALVIAGIKISGSLIATEVTADQSGAAPLGVPGIDCDCAPPLPE